MIRRRRGVSEVMGALLLIVVVIVVVASLAAFVSIAEKNAQNRQNYLTNVADENLQIVDAAFQANSTAENPIEPCTPTPPPEPTNCWRSDPTLWNSVTLTIRNTNTAPSELSQVKIGGTWISRWNQMSNGAVVLNQTSNEPINYGRGLGLGIPARGTVSIYVGFNRTYNFQQYVGSPPRNESISITLLSAIGNFFTTNYAPPTVVGRVSVTSVSYQDYSRDIVSLDGSQSSAANQSTIVSYAWNVLVPYASSVTSNGVPVNPDGCTSAAFSLPTQTGSALPPVYGASVTGKTTQFLQESSLPASLTNFCLTGPFEISLTVTDSLGFVGTSSSIGVASDPNMAPISTFSATLVNTSPTGPCTMTSTSCNVTGNVATIFGTPSPPNTYITILYNGDSTPVLVTNGDYSYQLPSCNSGASIQVSLDTLPSQVLQCPSQSVTTATTTITATTISTSTSTSTSTITTSLTAPSVIASASPDPVDPGQTALLTAYVSGGVAPYTYAWYLTSCTTGTLEQGPSASNSYTTMSLASTTQYCVQVKDSIGELATYTGPGSLVIVEPVLTVTITPASPAVGGEPITLTAEVTGGTGPYSYQWYSDSTCVGHVESASNYYTNLTLTSTTTYCVEVTDYLDSTATATDVVTITSGLMLQPQVSDTSILATGTLTVTGTIPSTGTSPYSWQWLVSVNGGAYGAPTQCATSSGSGAAAGATETCSIAANTLTAGDTYAFELQVTDSASEIQTSAPSATVTVT